MMLQKTGSIDLSKAGPVHPVINDATAGLVGPTDKLSNYLNARLATKADKNASSCSNLPPFDSTLYRVENDQLREKLKSLPGLDYGYSFNKETD